ncbi:hypothetical protein BKA81DRAFT_353995 [Phyllosticta paracitricarpa]
MEAPYAVSLFQNESDAWKARVGFLSFFFNVNPSLRKTSSYLRCFFSRLHSIIPYTLQQHQSRDSIVSCSSFTHTAIIPKIYYPISFAHRTALPCATTNQQAPNHQPIPPFTTPQNAIKGLRRKLATFELPTASQPTERPTYHCTKKIHPEISNTLVQSSYWFTNQSAQAATSNVASGHIEARGMGILWNRGRMD